MKRDDRVPDVAGRLPAHDLDAEAALLSAILDAGEVDRVSDLVAPEDFFADANRVVFEACLAVNAAGGTPNPVTVAGRLRDTQRLAQVGGAEYIARLATEIPYLAGTALEEAARRVRGKARVRRLVAECQRIAAEGYGDTGIVDDWINSAEAAIHAIVQGDVRANRLTSMRDALVRVFEQMQSPADMSGLRTGLPDLDRILGPMQPGHLVVIGALSGIGKSALAMNIAGHVAGPQRTGVLVFSAEMEADELATRSLFAEARVDSSKVNAKRFLTAEDYAALSESAGRVANSPIWIDDRPSITPAQIRARTRRLQSELKRDGRSIGLVVVDYVQLLDGKSSVPKGANREQEVAELSRSLKVLAKEAQLPVLALAQLNSDSEKGPGGGRKPRLNDLRESKALGQSADKVVLIHNPAAIARAEEYRQGSQGQHFDLPPETADLIVAKNRGSRTGTVQVRFWPSYTLFASADERSEEA